MSCMKYKYNIHCVHDNIARVPLLSYTEIQSICRVKASSARANYADVCVETQEIWHIECGMSCQYCYWKNDSMQIFPVTQSHLGSSKFVSFASTFHQFSSCLGNSRSKFKITRTKPLKPSVFFTSTRGF